MIYAYVLSPLTKSLGDAAASPRVDENARGRGASYRALKSRVHDLLGAFGFEEESLVRKRLLERLAVVDAEDLKLIHSACAKAECRVLPDSVKLRAPEKENTDERDEERSAEDS
jgi:hypothetical protein